MHILILSYDHIGNPWVGGGGAYRLHQVFSRMSSRHDITVVTGGWYGAKLQQEVEGVRYRLMGQSGSYLLSRMYYCAGAAAWAARGEHDLLVEAMSAFSPTFATGLSRKPAVADFGLNAFEAASKYQAIAPCLRARLKYDLEHCGGCIALSKSLGEQISDVKGGIPDVTVIPPGVDAVFVECEPVEEQYILFLGRIKIHHKGLDDLIDAFEAIHGQFPEIQLLIAGTGPDEGKLKDYIRRKGLTDAVTFCGWVDGRDKIDVLRKCLLVCMPSRQEGWGQVATEAAACGKPVIGYNVTGLKDSIIHKKTGLLVEPGDTDAFAEAAVKLLQDTCLRRQLGDHGRDRARHLTWDETASVYERKCEQVVQDGE